MMADTPGSARGRAGRTQHQCNEINCFWRAKALSLEMQIQSIQADVRAKDQRMRLVLADCVAVVQAASKGALQHTLGDDKQVRLLPFSEPLQWDC